MKQILAGALGALLIHGVANAAPSCSRAGAERVNVGDHKIWIETSGAGTPTVLFEAGSGNDSTAWGDIPEKVRAAARVRTVVYDRAGLGKSELQPGPFSIDTTVASLQRALDLCEVRAPVVLVAHSYAGFIAQLMAATDKRIAGVVLVDANLASFFDEAEVKHLLDLYQPQFGELEKAKPDAARVLIPQLLGYGDTVKRVRQVDFPATMPVIDIVAEKSWGETEARNQALRRAHVAFAAASPAREEIFVPGAGHFVWRDKPDVVLDAIKRMVEKVRAAR
ncbi:alpha/beta fold hydrolase [Roseiterribacter gracilis]|uniref:AB hydrolase-1 domain-containing protein n=1 Tax=Roseiterribacter gracilis TaxID=2812848 RepID=A0A8S8X8B5_9PROT|nr:hypothetical protein TMPK1_11210 [Rhodospirillales bacterium TMPK1]